MRFRQFIESHSEYTTDGTGDFKVKSIGAQELADWAEANCRGYLRRAKHCALFRGFESDTLFGMKDTNQFTRKSANTENYYTLWMDSSHAWKDYPRRSKSYVCSSAAGTADVFGSVHFVLVPDDLKVGVCPSNDLWAAFRPEIDSLDDLMLLVTTVFRELNIKAPDSSDELMNALEDASVDRLQKVERKLDIELKRTSTPDSLKWGSRSRLQRMVEQLKKEGASNLYEYFSKVINPQRYSFELQEGGNLQFPANREAWVQGKVGLVNLNVFSHAENTDPINDLFEKYDLHKKLGL